MSSSIASPPRGPSSARNASSTPIRHVVHRSGAGFGLSLASGRVRLPTYRRESLIPRVVHVGVGAFHRSHQAVYFDELAHLGADRWGLVGASLRSRAVIDDLRAQQGLYTLVERGAGGESARVIGSLVRCMFGPEDPQALTSVLSDERTRLVTLTVTGDAYESGPPPAGSNRGAWEYLVDALAVRRRAGIDPFTVLSCDNIPANGDAARTAVLRTAEARDEVLAKWIGRSVAFPCSMVDRITPGAADGQEDHVLREFGIKDRCSVAAEPFSQWVVEDNFCSERPPLELVGVQFVANVRPHGVMKNRLLNAGHSALGYLGMLAGHDTTDQAMADPSIRNFLVALMGREIAPLLPRVPGINLAAYQETLLERFSNPLIKDSLSRLCGRGSTKIPSYLLPSLHDALRSGRPTALLTLALAGWVRCLQGTHLDGRPLEIRDARAEELAPLARGSATDLQALLAKRDIFGDLIEHPGFVDRLRGALRSLEEVGVQATVTGHIAESDVCAA